MIINYLPNSAQGEDCPNFNNGGTPNQNKAQEVRYKVSFSDILLKEKPTDDKFLGKISNSFSTHYLTGDEIVDKILNGYSFSNIVWNEKIRFGKLRSIRNTENFIGHSLLVLDYDNNCRDANGWIVDCSLAEKDPSIIKPNVSPDEFLEMLREMGLECSFILTSMSDSDARRKFRVIWLCDVECNDPDTASMLFDGLIEAFKGDPATGILTQYYFPCTKLVYSNPSYFLSMADGSYQKFRQLLEEAAAKSRGLKPNLHTGAERSNSFESKNVDAVLLKYNKGASDLNKKTKRKKIQIKPKDKTLIYNHFRANSKLFQRFLEGKLKYEELKNLVLNLQYFTYSREVIETRMQEHDKTADRPYNNDDYRLVDDLFEGNYPIRNLKNLHGDEYEDFKFIYYHVIRKRKEVPFISIEEAEAKLANEIQSFINEPVKGRILIVKAEVGIGKSKCLLESINGVDCLIGFPTHQLMLQQAKDLKKNGIKFKKTEELPQDIPDHIMEVIKDYYRIGAIKEANRFIYNTIDSYPDKKCADALNEFLTNNKTALSQKGVSLTTHTRLIHCESPKQLIISDEDIIDEIYPVSTITKGDFNDLKDLVEFHPNLSSETKRLFDIINQTVKQSPNQVHLSVLTQIVEKDLKEIQKSIVKDFRGFETNVVKFLTATRYITINNESEGGKDKIHFLNESTKQLSTEKAYMILSATANPILYMLLGDLGFQIDFVEIERVKHNSIIYQDDSHSNSPYSLGKRKKTNPQSFKEYIEAVNALKVPVITHQKEKEQFKKRDKLCHFNRCSGLNHQMDKDICVVGAINRPTYNLALLASMIDKTLIGTDLPKPQFVEIESMAAAFPYYSYEHPILRSLHQHYAEESIIQAVGRSRHIRYNVKIYLLSSYYLYPEAILFKLSETMAQSSEEHQPIELLNDGKEADLPELNEQEEVESNYDFNMDDPFPDWDDISNDDWKDFFKD